MALFKRKLFQTPSALQFIVGFASSGLPWPIRWILGTRLVSKIVFFLVPVLITVGVLTLDWSNGWPTFSINRERASEVGQAAKDLAKEVQTRIPEGVSEKLREQIPESLSLDSWTSGVSPPETNAALPTTRGQGRVVENPLLRLRGYQERRGF